MQPYTFEYTRLITTPLGQMIASADEHAITSLDFGNTSVANSDHPLLLRLEVELYEYFAGKLKTFTLPLDPHGTPFQKEVWETLLSIPYGETISYAQEAEQFGNPKAVRAVANANGRNPIAILIPCHRVIATGGGLGGYSGGIEKKEFLLLLEKESRFF
ncbi:methylated-DNA--[protein]-cysteine S-methyltransferase [Sulfuricurvum sp.]|uniref:methylated-DNA--[protein]-cysteine S-methyltransferase n=1 Tax=Sulfuricurvum sp. TaxID=2025608 RepID=UPI0026280956|nr:methylated-DNA--[protein]-cysteine S-methyltransferase [Sulfuricurvum sp.]MDD2782360.1 methylated-DNA--[protein]-cysteine S-methyltransferase [Sulfuricurvum sp.]